MRVPRGIYQLSMSVVVPIVFHECLHESFSKSRLAVSRMIVSSVGLFKIVSSPITQIENGRLCSRTPVLINPNHSGRMSVSVSESLYKSFIVILNIFDK